MTGTPDQFAGARVLIVDDEGTQRLLTRDCLEDAGFCVEEACDGEDGLKKIKTLQPDIVLLDVMMPGMDGFQVCEQIRSDPVIRHTPVIIVTGREDIEDIRKGFAAGASDFLTKPLNWNLLPNRISFVLRAGRLESDLRASKEATEKAYEAKSTLLSTMGHELRTPLNAIIGFSDLIKQQVYGPLGAPEYGEFIDDIHTSGNKLLSGINDVLEIADSETHELDSNHHEADLHDLVKFVVDSVAPMALSADISIVNDVTANALRIDGDLERLQRAVQNLITNAIKFNEPGGEVRISATASADNGVVLTIADTGIGISASELARVMEPFEQVDASLSRSFDGMGLGLPVARALVRLHGGDIVLESEPGRGTAAKITLPPERCKSSPSQNNSPEIRQSSAGN
jgi:signal transduction histidine kinase